MNVDDIPKNVTDRINHLCKIVRDAKECESPQEHDERLLDLAEGILKLAEKATEMKCTRHMAHTLIVMCLDVFESEGVESTEVMRALQVDKINGNSPDRN